MDKKKGCRSLAASIVLFLGLTTQSSGLESKAQLDVRCLAPDVKALAKLALPRVTARLELRKPLRIVAIGSSSTFGVGSTSASKTYPAQLRAALDRDLGAGVVEVLNFGVSGETIRNTIPRMKFEIGRINPTLVVWQLGTNDALSRVPLEEFSASVRDTLSWLGQTAAVDTILVGMQWTPALAKDANYTAFNHEIGKIAAGAGIGLVPRYETMAVIGKTGGIGPMLSSDNFHQSDLGYHCMAEQIAAVILLGIANNPRSE